VSPVRPLDHGGGIECQDAEVTSHQVGVAFGGVGLSGLELLTSALSERFWPVAPQRSQDRIARPERCEASRGLAPLWCAFEALESRSPLRQRPLSRSSDDRF
jgi:hypothetical protein